MFNGLINWEVLLGVAVTIVTVMASAAVYQWISHPKIIWLAVLALICVELYLAHLLVAYLEQKKSALTPAPTAPAINSSGTPAERPVAGVDMVVDRYVRDSDSKLAEATARIAALDAELATARQTLEKMTGARDEEKFRRILLERFVPRTISGFQSEVIPSRLMGQPSTPVDIFVVGSPNSDAMNLAKQIVGSFRIGRWQPKLWNVVKGWEGLTGFHVFTIAELGSVAEALRAILKTSVPQIPVEITVWTRDDFDVARYGWTVTSDGVQFDIAKAAMFRIAIGAKPQEQLPRGMSYPVG
jgi:hypothetical protein